MTIDYTIKAKDGIEIAIRVSSRNIVTHAKYCDLDPSIQQGFNEILVKHVQDLANMLAETPHELDREGN